MTEQPSRALVLAAGSMLDQPATVLVDAAAAAGFEGVGLRSSGVHDADPALVRARAAERGVTIHDVEVHRIGTDPADPTRLVDRAVALGATALLVVSDLPDPVATASALTTVVARCRDAGLRVGLEYMAWTTPSDPLGAIEIAHRTGCELVVDLLHHVRVGAGTDELDAIVDAGVLGWVQLCDAPLAAPADLLHEARHGRLVPGTGGLPITDLLARVPAGTTISVEVQRDELLHLAPTERARLLHDSSRSVLGRSGQRPSSTG